MSIQLITVFISQATRPPPKIALKIPCLIALIDKWQLMKNVLCKTCHFVYGQFKTNINTD